MHGNAQGINFFYLLQGVGFSLLWLSKMSLGFHFTATSAVGC
jgi:hypothetical protein